jgi:hypothetical protein
MTTQIAPAPPHKLTLQEYKKGDLTQTALASFGLNTLPGFYSQEDIYVLRLYLLQLTKFLHAILYISHECR